MAFNLSHTYLVNLTWKYFRIQRPIEWTYPNISTNECEINSHTKNWFQITGIYGYCYCVLSNNFIYRFGVSTVNGLTRVAYLSGYYKAKTGYDREVSLFICAWPTWSWWWDSSGGKSYKTDLHKDMMNNLITYIY